MIRVNTKYSYSAMTYLIYVLYTPYKRQRVAQISLQAWQFATSAPIGRILHVWSMLFILDSRLHLYILRVAPRHLEPWGFQWRPLVLMLSGSRQSVCPIQTHVLGLIFFPGYSSKGPHWLAQKSQVHKSTGPQFKKCGPTYNSRLEIMFSQNIVRILLKHIF